MFGILKDATEPSFRINLINQKSYSHEMPFYEFWCTNPPVLLGIASDQLKQLKTDESTLKNY